MGRRIEQAVIELLHRAARRKRRQVYVGIPTVMNILGERLAPWLLDRYLATSAYKSQMTGDDLDPQGHDNLFEPVDEDRGAHGPFDEKAHRISPQYELAKRRGRARGRRAVVRALTPRAWVAIARVRTN